MKWPDGYRACASFTFDVDGEAPVLAADPSATSRLSLMSHQAYGPDVGLRRILKVLDELSVRATFFVPGFVAEHHPGSIREVLAAGHEVGHHGYLHRAPNTLDSDGQRQEFEGGLIALERFGAHLAGYRAPMWELTEPTLDLLIKHGLRYDSSLMDADRPYRLQTDSGELVELPIHWGLDDWEQYGFVPGISSVTPLSSPDAVERMWLTELEQTVAEGGHFLLTCHPFLSGRPSRALVLASLVRRCETLGGVWVAALEDVVDHVVAELPNARPLHRYEPLE
ncbi:MAG: polysaccharide deacetylase family protein [Acidimicrobiales bacterium]